MLASSASPSRVASAVEVDGVYVYRRSPDGKIASLRAFWEPDAIRTFT